MKSHLLLARVLLSCAAHCQNLAAVLDGAVGCPPLASCTSVSARWHAGPAAGYLVPDSLPVRGPAGNAALANGLWLRRPGPREIVTLQRK